jgi:hypothetical protein
VRGDKHFFQGLEIMTLPSQCILFLITFLIHDLQYIAFNFSVHSINTRKKVWLHRPIANFASYQRGIMQTKIFLYTTSIHCWINQEWKAICISSKKEFNSWIHLLNEHTFNPLLFLFNTFSPRGVHVLRGLSRQLSWRSTSTPQFP